MLFGICIFLIGICVEGITDAVGTGVSVGVIVGPGVVSTPSEDTVPANLASDKQSFFSRIAGRTA